MTKPFNHPLEVGIRALAILLEVYPVPLDLQQLVFFDYITVHTEDFGGAESLHAPLPMRSSELSIKRRLVERGLMLLMSKGLIERLNSSNGFQYIATDSADPFFSMLMSPYIITLKQRVEWVIGKYGDKRLEELAALEQITIKQKSHLFYLAESDKGVKI